MSALAKVIARDSGLDTRDLRTATVNRGAWEEISMDVLSTSAVEGWWWWWLYFVTYLLIRSFWVSSPCNERPNSPDRVLSRIYSLGEKSQVAEGDKLPRGSGGVPPLKRFWNEYALRCNLLHLRHNCEKCYCVCIDLIANLNSSLWQSLLKLECNQNFYVSCLSF